MNEIVIDPDGSLLKRFGRSVWKHKWWYLAAIVLLALYARHSEQVNSFTAETWQKWFGDKDNQQQLAVADSTTAPNSRFDRDVEVGKRAIDKYLADQAAALDAKTSADAAIDANWNAMTANDSALVIRFGTEVAMVYGDTVLEKGLAYKGKYLLVDQRKAKPGKIWIQDDSGWKEVARKK